MERETKSVELPFSKKQAVLKAWLTGVEIQNAQRILLEGTKVNKDMASDPSSMSIPASAAIDYRNKILETVIIFIDGKEDVLAQLNDLHARDYNFLQQEADKVAEESVSVDSEKKDN